MLFSGYSAVDNFIFNSINQIFNFLFSILISKIAISATIFLLIEF